MLAQGVPARVGDGRVGPLSDRFDYEHLHACPARAQTGRYKADERSDARALAARRFDARGWSCFEDRAPDVSSD